MVTGGVRNQSSARGRRRRLDRHRIPAPPDTAVSQRPPAAETSYRSYYNSIDHVLAAVECGPAGLVRTGEELIDPRGGSEFNSDFMRPHCMQDGLFVRLAAPGRPTTLLVVSARATHSFATEERTRLLSALVPHLQQALHAESVLAQTVRQTRILEDVLNVDDRGVVVVSAEGAVWSANAAASEIFTVDDGISVRGGRIVTDALRGSIAMALSAGSDGLRRGSWIRCPRPSGKEPYVANVVPIGDPTGPDHRALVVLNDPAGHKDQSAEEIVRDLYGLTPTETRFVALLRDGNSLADVADRLSVSLTTVRTHLQHVFRKTGTHRQTELVRLLLSVDGRP